MTPTDDEIERYRELLRRHRERDEKVDLVLGAEGENWLRETPPDDPAEAEE